MPPLLIKKLYYKSLTSFDYVNINNIFKFIITFENILVKCSLKFRLTFKD